MWDDARLPSKLLKRERPTSLFSGQLHQPLGHQDDLSNSVDQDPKMNISYQTYERVKLNFADEDSMYYMAGGNSSFDNEDPNISVKLRN